MPSLSEVISDFDLLVTMKPHDLAPVLLRLASDHRGVMAKSSKSKTSSCQGPRPRAQCKPRLISQNSMRSWRILRLASGDPIETDRWRSE
jgi:hypothetical protein